MKLKELLAALFLALLAESVLGQVVISELMAAGGALADEDGDTPDWIEIWNTGPTSLNLEAGRL